MNTKELIKNTFGVVLALTIIIFVVMLIAYGCSGIANPLKETLTITIGFFGGFTTLGAAYIAANLFDDWRVIEDHKTKNRHIENAQNIFFRLKDYIKSKTIQMVVVEATSRQRILDFDEKFKLLIDVGECQNELQQSLATLKMHIQLFATSAENLNLCGEFEKIIDEKEIEIIEKHSIIMLAIQGNSNLDLADALKDYTHHLSGKFTLDIYLKITSRLNSEMKALT